MGFEISVNPFESCGKESKFAGRSLGGSLIGSGLNDIIRSGSVRARLGLENGGRTHLKAYNWKVSSGYQTGSEPDAADFVMWQPCRVCLVFAGSL